MLEGNCARDEVFTLKLEFRFCGAFCLTNVYEMLT